MGDQLDSLLSRLDELNAYSAKDLLLFLVKRHHKMNASLADMLRIEWQWCGVTVVESMSVGQVRLALGWRGLDSYGTEKEVRDRLRDARLNGTGKQVRGKDPPRRRAKRVKLAEN
jgi:hypothetical protein